MFTDGGQSGPHTLNKRARSRGPKIISFDSCQSKDLSLCYYFQAGIDEESDYATICGPMQPYACLPK